MNKINIMHLTHSVVRGSGPESLILKLAEKIDRSRFNMSIVSLTSPTPIAFAFLEKAEQVCSQTDHIPWKRTKPFFSSIYKLCRLIRKHNVHILHTHDPRTNFAGLIAARLTGTRIIASTHGYVLFGVPLKLAVYQYVDIVMLRLFDRIHVSSDAWRRRLSQRRVSLERITSIHYGLDAKRFASDSYDPDHLKTKYNLNSECKLIATVGRLSREKGHRFLLQAAQELIREVSGVVFLIVGEGSIRGELEDYCVELGISENVIFTGFCHDVLEILYSIDIMVLPSLTESFPFAVLEAMFAGKPVVATDVGGVSEMIHHQETGLLIQPADSSSLAGAIALLLRNEHMRNVIAQNAQKLANTEFTVENYAKRIQDLYTCIISGE